MEVAEIKTWIDGTLKRDGDNMAMRSKGEFFTISERKAIIESVAGTFKRENSLNKEILDELKKFEEGDIDSFAFSVKPKFATGLVMEVEVRLLDLDDYLPTVQ